MAGDARFARRLQRELDHLGPPFLRRDGRAERLEPALAHLDDVRRRRQRQHLVRRAARGAVHVQDRVGRLALDAHFAEHGPELHRDAPLGAALDRDRLRRGRVAGERQQHVLRHAGRHADRERRASAIAAADADVGARGPAVHDQAAIRHAELDRADRERLARDHGERALEAAELRMHDRERVAAGVELGLERRRAELAVVGPHRRAGGHRSHGDAREDGLQLDLERLPLAAARDHEAQAFLGEVRRRHGELARAGGQLVLARQRADRAAVHRERRGDAAGVESDAARQALERDDVALARQAADDDRLARRRESFGLDAKLVAAGRHEVAAAEAEVERRAFEVHAVEVGLGIGRHLDRRSP